MAEKFTYQRVDKDGTSAIALEGIIDEDVMLDAVFANPLPVTAIDCGAVTRINSCGIRSWVNAVQALCRRSEVTFVNCSPIIVRQFNMISNFGGAGRVVSFKLPYFCPQCRKEHDVTADAAQYLREHADLSAPKQNCPTCGSELEFDDIAEKYFFFLKQR